MCISLRLRFYGNFLVGKTRKRGIMNVDHRRMCTHSNHNRFSKLGRFALVILLLFFSGCTEYSEPMNNYCTQECTDLFNEPTKGYWRGNDVDLDLTRCVCMNIDEGTDHVFDWYWPLDNETR